MKVFFLNFQVHVSFKHYTTPHVLSIKFEKLTQPILELTKKLLLVASWTRMKDLSKWFDFFIPTIIDSDPILSQNWNPNSLKWNLMHFYGKGKKNRFSTNVWKFVTTVFDTWPLFFNRIHTFSLCNLLLPNLSHFQWSIIGFSFQFVWLRFSYFHIRDHKFLTKHCGENKILNCEKNPN